MILNYMNLFLFFLLASSVYFDFKQRKIPNKITMPTILISVIWSTVNSGLDGFLFSGLGFLVGFAVFLVPYLFGGIGAGDVKLMAAIGSLMGWRFAVMSGLSAAIAGGGLVVIYMLIKGGIKQTFVDAVGLLLKPFLKLLYMASGKTWFLAKQKYFMTYKVKREDYYIPYALAIAAGTLVVLIFRLDSLTRF